MARTRPTPTSPGRPSSTKMQLARKKHPPPPKTSVALAQYLGMERRPPNNHDFFPRPPSTLLGWSRLRTTPSRRLSVVIASLQVNKFQSCFVQGWGHHVSVSLRRPPLTKAAKREKGQVCTRPEHDTYQKRPTRAVYSETRPHCLPLYKLVALGKGEQRRERGALLTQRSSSPL